MVGKMVLTPAGAQQPDARLLPALDDAQMQFVYSHCVFTHSAPRRVQIEVSPKCGDT